MHRIIICCLFFLTILFSCNTVGEGACHRFKNGKYIYNSKFDSTTTFIERRDSLQVEIRKEDTINLRVKWVSECEYELTYFSEIVNTKEVNYNSLQIDPVYIKIVKAGKDYYVFEGLMDGWERKLVDTMRIYRQ